MHSAPLPVELGPLEAAFQAAPASRLFAPLAEAYRQAGKVQKAVEILQRGTQRHPEYVSAWVLLGLCQRDLSVSEAAEISFARVLALDPENLVALKHRAQRALEATDPATAAALVERVLEIDPYDREALRLRDDVATYQDRQPVETAAEVTTVPPPRSVARDADRAAAEEPPILDLQELVDETETEAAPGIDRDAAGEWQVQRDADRIVIRPRSDQPTPAGPATTDEFSTLTLARIYESQGYDDKALAIYAALLGKDAENPELQERVRTLQQRLGSGRAAAPRPEPTSERRWRLVDAEKLGADADQTAEQLRRLADRVRDREEGKRHTVIGRAPEAPSVPAPETVRGDEPDFERFLRYVRSLKR